MKLLVLGHAGLLGKQLVRVLQEDHEVAGIDVISSAELPDNPAPLLSLCETNPVFDWIREYRPGIIINCAGKFRGGDLDELMEINCLAPMRLVRAVADAGLPCRIVLVGSAAEYGLRQCEEPISEEIPLNPVNEYGISKAAQTFAVRMECLRAQADVVLARPFNILGPGMSTHLFLGSMMSQLRRIETGEEPPVLKVGNLHTARDFLRADDIARMLLTVALDGAKGSEYNLCSGTPLTMEALLGMLVQASGQQVTLERDPSRMRRIDPKVFFGDPTKAAQLEGFPKARPIDTEFIGECYRAVRAGT